MDALPLLVEWKVGFYSKTDALKEGFPNVKLRFSSGIAELKNKNYEVKRVADIKYEIVKTIGILSEGSKGWTKELNLISWNEKEPKYDIREWAPDHLKMGKGVTLSRDEFVKLQTLMEDEVE